MDVTSPSTVDGGSNHVVVTDNAYINTVCDSDSDSDLVELDNKWQQLLVKHGEDSLERALRKRGITDVDKTSFRALNAPQIVDLLNKLSPSGSNSIKVKKEAVESINALHDREQKVNNFNSELALKTLPSPNNKAKGKGEIRPVLWGDLEDDDLGDQEVFSEAERPDLATSVAASTQDATFVAEKTTLGVTRGDLIEKEDIGTDRDDFELTSKQGPTLLKVIDEDVADLNGKNMELHINLTELSKKNMDLYKSSTDLNELHADLNMKNSDLYIKSTDLNELHTDLNQTRNGKNAMIMAEEEDGSASVRRCASENCYCAAAHGHRGESDMITGPITLTSLAYGNLAVGNLDSKNSESYIRTVLTSPQQALRTPCARQNVPVRQFTSNSSHGHSEKNRNTREDHASNRAVVQGCTNTDQLQRGGSSSTSFAGHDLPSVAANPLNQGEMHNKKVQDNVPLTVNGRADTYMVGDRPQTACQNACVIELKENIRNTEDSTSLKRYISNISSAQGSSMGTPPDTQLSHDIPNREGSYNGEISETSHENSGMHTSQNPSLVDMNGTGSCRIADCGSAKEKGAAAAVGRTWASVVANHDEHHDEPHHDETESQWVKELDTGNRGKETLMYIPPSVVNGRPVVHVQSNQFEHAEKKFGELVVGMFVGKRLPYMFVKQYCERTWVLKQRFIMRSRGDKMYTFEFESHEDRRAVLDTGSFHIASNLFIVRPWRLFIEAEATELKTMPIWVTLLNYPMEMCDRDGFSRVGSAIGTPLFADKLTEDLKRDNIARLCVEINTNCQYPDTVPVIVDLHRVVNIPVVYNWRPPLCSHCDVFGHTDSSCPVNPSSKSAHRNVSNSRPTHKIWLQKQGKESTISLATESSLQLANEIQCNKTNNANVPAITVVDTIVGNAEIDASNGLCQQSKADTEMDSVQAATSNPIELGWEIPKRRHTTKVHKALISFERHPLNKDNMKSAIGNNITQKPQSECKDQKNVGNSVTTTTHSGMSITTPTLSPRVSQSSNGDTTTKQKHKTQTRPSNEHVSGGNRGACRTTNQIQTTELAQKAIKHNQVSGGNQSEYTSVLVSNNGHEHASGYKVSTHKGQDNQMETVWGGVKHGPPHTEFSMRS